MIKLQPLRWDKRSESWLLCFGPLNCNFLAAGGVKSVCKREERKNTEIVCTLTTNDNEQ